MKIILSQAELGAIDFQFLDDVVVIESHGTLQTNETRMVVQPATPRFPFVPWLFGVREIFQGKLCMSLFGIATWESIVLSLFLKTMSAKKLSLLLQPIEL